MMEARPLPGLQTAVTQSTHPSAQGAEQPVAGDSNFEQQLSHQLDQASTASNAENSDNNQVFEDYIEGLDGDYSASSESTDFLLGENPDLPLTVDALALDTAEMAPPQVLASILETGEDVQIANTGQADQTLPLAGNVLPSVDAPLPVTETPLLPPMPPMPSMPSMPSNTPVVTPVVTPVTVELPFPTTANTAVIQSAPDLTSKTSQVQTPVNIPQAQAELSDKPVQFPEMEIIKASSGNQESQQQMNQSRPGISIASSVAAAASQLQQVPLTTASAHLHLPTSAIPVDSMLSLGMNPAGQGIASPVQSQAWSQGLTEQVSWMVRGNIQSAEIKLNPANLGPLEVKLSIEDDVARLSFVSSHAPVREALDAAMPRLREMLEQQGISLGDVDVSQYSEQDQQSAEESAASTGLSGQSESPDLVEDQAGVNRISINDGFSIYA